MSYGIQKKTDLKLEKIAKILLEKKAGFGEDVTREGIEIAKKLKSKGLHNNLRGNAMKDYMHHMDMSAHPKFMQGVKLKAASALVEHAAEVGGLGILAAPHIYHAVTGKKVSNKTERNTELAGLGVLAAHPAHALGKAMMSKMKHAGVGAALVKMAGAFDKVNALPAKPAPAPKPQFTMEHLNAQRQKLGLRTVAPRPMTPRTGSLAAKAVSTGAAHAKPGLLGKALSIFK
jgi:hypothetical protein